MELPLDPGVTLGDLQELYRLLVDCGAPIDEINAVRKHLSAVKGGRLAAAAPAAMKITLGVSDVPEGRESALASGPTLPDPTTAADACRVIERYALMPKLPPAFREIFSHPEQIPETPKPGDPAFARAISCCCSEATICSISARQAAEETQEIASPSATTPPTIGRSAKPPIICWRASSACATPIPAAASPSSPMAKSARR